MKNQPSLLSEHLAYLKLKYVADQYGPLADEAIRQPWDHREYLRRLIEGEYNDQRQRRVAARIKSARFPVIKTSNSSTGPGPRKSIGWPFKACSGWSSWRKTPTSSSWATSGSENPTWPPPWVTLLAWRARGPVRRRHRSHQRSASGPEKWRTQRALKKYLRPEIVILDEVGYLPIDQKGADLLFQVISQRYERGSILLTTNKPFKQWGSIFNNDSTIASAGSTASCIMPKPSSSKVPAIG